MRYDSASTTSTAAPPSVRHEKRAPRPVSASSPKPHRKAQSTSNTAIGQVSQMLLYTSGVKKSKNFHLSLGQVHQNFYLSCYQITCPCQGKIDYQ